MNIEERGKNLTIEDVEISIVDLLGDTNESHINYDSSQNSKEIIVQDSDEVVGDDYQTNHDNSLLNKALDRNLNNEDIVNEWIDEYKNNSNDTLVTFVQFVIEASGSRYKIPKDTKLTSKYIDILIDGTAKFCNISAYYPMTKKGASLFMENVEKFLKCFFLSIDATPIMNDNVFLGHVTGFVMACSQSKIRAFRHTSTMIGLKMLTIFNDLTSIEYEKHKTLWLKMFQCVFQERYRDVVDDIRYLCIAEYFTWFKNYSEGFLKPQDIEYIFKALRDEYVKIRELSLMALHQLYAKRDLRKICLEQGKKYINDLIAIILDNENELGEQAVSLLEKFTKGSSIIIDDSQFIIIDQLIFAAHRGLAQTAAKLFTYRYLNDENCPPDRLICQLIEFFEQFGQHEHAAYFVDSFFGNNAIILDWPTMIQMLIKEPMKLDENHQLILIEILSRGVKQAVTGEIPAGRYTKNLARKPKAGAQDLATETLAPVIPLLLSKYRNRCDNLINLLELPQYLNISYYQTEDNREQLVQFLEIIEQIIFENDDINILRMAAATLEFIYQIPCTKYHRKKLFDTAVRNYENAYQIWHNAYQIDIHIKRLLTTLRVLSSLCGYFNLDKWNISDTIRSRLQMATQNYNPSQDQSLLPKAMCLHLEICYLNLSWDLKRVKDLALNNVEAVVDMCMELKENLEFYFFTTCYLIENNGNTDIAHDAFVFTCDLLVLFGDQLRQDSNSFIRSLQYQLSINEYELFDNFVLRNAFQCEEAANELLHKENYDKLESRRRILSSYCKLVALNLMPIMRASIIFQYYHTFYEAFGDILNATMELGLNINTIHYGMTLFHTCLLVYKRIKAANDGSIILITQTIEFSDLIKLAKRLAETLNSKLLKNRSGVVALHRSGILFVSEIAPNKPTSAPENLSFLRILEEFVPQLLSQDKLEILNFLECIEEPSLPSCNREEWQPLARYRMALEMALKKSCRRSELNERLNYETTKTN